MTHETPYCMFSSKLPGALALPPRKERWQLLPIGAPSCGKLLALYDTNRHSEAGRAE